MPPRTARLSTAAAVALLLALAWAHDPRPAHAAKLISSLEGAGQSPRAVVLFQMGDCAETRDELARWSAVSAPGASRAPSDRGEPGIRVDGVLVGPLPRDREQIRRILEEAGVDFPVQREGAEIAVGLARALGYARTPLVLIFDGDGRLSLAGPLEAMDPGELARRGLLPQDGSAVTP